MCIKVQQIWENNFAKLTMMNVSLSEQKKLIKQKNSANAHKIGIYIPPGWVMTGKKPKQ